MTKAILDLEDDVNKALTTLVESATRLERDSGELGYIRATLLLNFGEHAPHNKHGFSIKNEGSTHNLMMEVLKQLIHKPIDDLTAGTINKGGQNPPNTSTARPTPPTGSLGRSSREILPPEERPKPIQR